MKKNKGLFEEYFNSIFKQGNIFTKEQYEKASDNFDSNYGKLLPEDVGAPILDVGCGTGHFLYYLKRKDYKNFLGIDISPQQIEFCQRNISKNVKLADAFEFLKDSQITYDVIVAHDFLEHMSKDKIFSFLELAYKSLNTKGIFIMRVPNMSNPFSMDSRYKDFTHETGFTEKSLYQILWMVGFREIQIFSTKIQIRSFRNRIRSILVWFLHKWISFLYYIQDFTVPKHLGKNLTAICRR